MTSGPCPVLENWTQVQTRILRGRSLCFQSLEFRFHECQDADEACETRASHREADTDETNIFSPQSMRNPMRVDGQTLTPLHTTEKKHQSYKTEWYLNKNLSQWLHTCCCRSSHNRLPVKNLAILCGRSRQRRESRCRKWSLVQQRKKRQRDMVPGRNALFPEVCKNRKYPRACYTTW